MNPHSSDFGDICALHSPFSYQLTGQSSVFEPGCLQPCPSYSRRGTVLIWDSCVAYTRGQGVHCCTSICSAPCVDAHWGRMCDSPTQKLLEAGSLMNATFTPPMVRATPQLGCCLIRARTVRAPCILLGIVYYPVPERLLVDHWLPPF